MDDPIGFRGGINLYAYAYDNPVNFSDPFGRDVTITRWPGAGGNGHIGVGVNTTDTVGFYPRSHSLCLIFGCDVPGAVEDDQLEYPGVLPEVIVIPTSPDQDAAMQRALTTGGATTTCTAAIVPSLLNMYSGPAGYRRLIARSHGFYLRTCNVNTHNPSAYPCK